jgi:hypothetical protein
LDSKLIENPENIYASSDVIVLMQLVIDRFELDISDVIPIISLAMCRGPNEVIDYICLHSLRRVVDQASADMMYKLTTK